MGCMLVPESNEKAEKAIYYLSKKMLDYETCYTPLENACLALVWATKKLRHYLLTHSTILYVTRKSINERAVAEFLADHPIEEKEAMGYSFPDEEVMQIKEDTWKLYFDRASNQFGYVIGVLLIALDDSHIHLAFELQFRVSNNQAEYDACIAGLEVALELGAIRLDVIGDSNLVISQANGN
ncbi:uncharacterized protein LOC114322183 [Camellia sinensis]|uniref:uncharacterized protein LOC114322183 n=1 Tax=Camellia sinensis TaxID=4442 RepID=UPI001035D47C|nr:uncharacterized protein LOC114322183 [Camellia sinensis]